MHVTQFMHIIQRILSSDIISSNGKPFKNSEKCFYFTLKASFFVEVIRFFFLLSDHVGKQLDKKAKVNFNIYDVTNRIKNNSNRLIARYLKKYW